MQDYVQTTINYFVNYLILASSADIILLRMFSCPRKRSTLSVPEHTLVCRLGSSWRKNPGDHMQNGVCSSPGDILSANSETRLIRKAGWVTDDVTHAPLNTERVCPTRKHDNFKRLGPTFLVERHLIPQLGQRRGHRLSES